MVSPVEMEPAVVPKPSNTSLVSLDSKCKTEITLGIFEVAGQPRSPEDERLASHGLERRKDGLVYWNSNSKDHPRNWSAWRKSFDTSVIVLLEFYT
jgi:hypothetical protein